MTLTSPTRHQRTDDDQPPRKRGVRLLLGGASLVALAGLGVALFSAQLGETTASHTELPVQDTVLAEPSDLGPVETGDSPVSETDGAENPDGRLQFGTTAFDTEYAGIGKLSPELRDALQAATRDAQSAGVSVMVNSGWRSVELQEQLLQDAVAEYGSEEEASRWVASPETSLHVSGDAVDVEGNGASDWLATNGASYGLCLTYLNEPWHFEYQAAASANGCAQPYADPTDDPRLRG